MKPAGHRAHARQQRIGYPDSLESFIVRLQHVPTQTVAFWTHLAQTIPVQTRLNRIENCCIDTDALMGGYGRALRRRGGEVLTSAPVVRIASEASGWRVWTDAEEFSAGALVNAAGAWVQQIARMAGLGYRNVVPFRRTAVTFDPPAGSDIRR